MKPKSIYKYAAENGIPLGLYLTLMSACLLMSLKFPVLPVFLLPLSIGFPFLLWYLLRKIGKEEESYMKFSSLWLGGIYSVIFGTVICLFLSSLYVTFIEPGFFVNYIKHSIEVIEASDISSQYGAGLTLMKEAIEAKLLPTSMEFLTTMAWLTCFAGCILSLILALLIPKAGSKVRRISPR